MGRTRIRLIGGINRHSGRGTPTQCDADVVDVKRRRIYNNPITASKVDPGSVQKRWDMAGIDVTGHEILSWGRQCVGFCD